MWSKVQAAIAGFGAMSSSANQWFCRLPIHWLISFLSVVAGMLPGFAQITPDATLGAEQSLLQGALINGGAQRGANLFHSFLQFNVADGQRIDFANPVGVDRILTRVTGATRSQIFGTLGVLGNADLFLINPNGIVFGPNAQLDVSGSFVATTANSLLFDNGFGFSTTNPQAPPLLTIRVPIGLQYGTNAGAIAVQGSQLIVPPGQTMALVGGDVQLQNNAVVFVPDAHLELGGLSAAGVVGLETTSNGFQLQFPAGVARSQVSMSGGSVIQATSDNGGSVVVNANTFQVSEDSQILVLTLGAQNATQATRIDATDSVLITGQNSSVLTFVNGGSRGTGAPLAIKTRTLTLADGGQLGTITVGAGNAGALNIAASDAVILVGVGESNPNALTALASQSVGAGNGGNVTITTNKFILNQGAQLGALAFGSGQGGNVSITATDVAVEGGFLASVVGSDATGNGGNLAINTNSLRVTAEGQLGTNTDGPGAGGALTITARESVVFDGAGARENVGTGAFSRSGRGFVSPGLQVGNGGTIDITTPSLVVTNGALIDASAFKNGQSGDVALKVQNLSVLNGGQIGARTIGTANAGTVRIVATGAAILDGDIAGRPSGVVTNVEEGAIGNGGDIFVQSNSLQITNNAGLFANTRGQGDAGRIQVQAATNVRLATGGSILSTVEPTGIGNGQAILLQTPSLELTDNAQVSASTAGNGDAGQIQVIADRVSIDRGGQLLTTTTSQRNAGDIRLQVRDHLTLSDDNSGLFANTAVGSSGKGGTIFVNAGDLTLQDKARIAVDSQGTGSGGNIQLQTDALTLDRQAEILAETSSNTGGNITLDVRDILLLRRNSLISTTAGKAQGTGDGGNITINAGFIVAALSENSDITANAFAGRGGNIVINTQGIFGIQFRDRLTPLSDITASSELGLNGIVTINTLGLDPNRGTVELPTTFTTPPLTQGCYAPTYQTSRFVNIGRGGVPINPTAPLSADTIWEDLDLPLALEHRSQRAEPTKKATTPTQTPFSSGSPRTLEAQGWQVFPDGTILLTTQASTIKLPACHQATCNSMPQNAETGTSIVFPSVNFGLMGGQEPGCGENRRS